jgi:hypothetical protein
MAVGVEAKKILRPEMNLRGDFIKYDNFVVLIRHDSAEIWVFGYSTTLGLGTKKKRPAPVFLVFRFVYSIAPLRFFHHYQARFSSKKGHTKPQLPKMRSKYENLPSEVTNK